MAVVVSQIGLPKKDIILLKSIFSVLALGATRGINDEIVFVHNAIIQTDKNISFVDNEKRRSPGRLADIVFIDGDNKSSIQIWQSLKNSNPLTTVVIVTNNDILNSTNEIVLKRPLNHKTVLATLTEITNSYSQKKILQSRSTNLNVLVVDDSFMVRKYMEVTLPKLFGEGIKIDFAVSGEDAIQKVEGKIYGLVFLDVIMSGIDGYKTCKIIKSKTGSQVVMLTSKKSPFDKVRGSMSGCYAYLTKPPKDAQLKNVLEKFMAEQY